MRKLLTALLFSVCVSQATIIINTGNSPSGTENNVLLNNGMTGTTITGTFAQSTAAVPTFQSTETLSAPASGQARVEATDGLLNSVTFFLGGGFTFGDLIFALNPASGGPPTNPDYTIVAHGTVTSTVQSSGTLGPGNGNTFFTITTSGETLNSVVLSSTVGFGSVQQFRVSGITAPSGGGGGGGGGGGAVPEPSTVAMIAGGLGLLALGRKVR